MRNSKRRESEGGGDKRRQSRERAREARRRRKELERRAAAQSRPATRKREQDRRRPGKAGRGAAGIPREIGRRLALPRLIAALRRPAAWALRLIGFAIFWLAARIDRAGRAVAAKVAGPTASAVAWLGRTLTPRRMAMAVAVVAGACVLAAQAIDYRAVAIGESAYADVASLAQAPLTGHETPWAAHGPLVGLLAILATGGALVTLRGVGRRAFPVALGASALALLVILAIDLPRSSDLGTAVDEYAGTGAVLLNGFYIELVATLLIGFSAALPRLWRLPFPGPRQLAAARRKDPASRPEPRQRSLSGEQRRTA